MKKVLFAASILLIFSFCLNYQCWAADEETLGKEAEQAGKLREALTHYVKEMQGTPYLIRNSKFRLNSKFQFPTNSMLRTRSFVKRNI